ncbi:MAG: ribosome silencing factor [Bacteroidetes bacterium]|nr:ribosome silencing factor [Bacteroidota bacterium]
MAKKQVKKTLVKKSAAKKSAKKTAAKKTGKSSGTKKIVKKELTDKERAFREANLIANSEKKKTIKSKRPKKSATPAQTLSLVDAVVEGMREKKAKNITILNLKNIENRVTDYFVICDAESNTHVNSIADSVEEIVEKFNKETPYHSEGKQNGEWILIDYINVVAHVFLREMREHYNIEGLWGDAEFTAIED